MAWEDIKTTKLPFPQQISAAQSTAEHCQLFSAHEAVIWRVYFSKARTLETELSKLKITTQWNPNILKRSEKTQGMVLHKQDRSLTGKTLKLAVTTPKEKNIRSTAFFWNSRGEADFHPFQFLHSEHKSHQATAAGNQWAIEDFLWRTDLHTYPPSPLPQPSVAFSVPWWPQCKRCGLSQW